MSDILFTDKYMPKTYVDLLTEEKINRELLTWMKSWDEIVFHKKFTIPKIPLIQQNNNNNSNTFTSNYNNNNKNQNNITKKNFQKNISSNNINNNKSNNNNNNQNHSSLMMNNNIQYIEVDYIQSKHKIILICGPPGYGKTTLAKIVSIQCGYEPIIINASDERTVDKLITRIYDTTLIHNLSKNKKPTCLILDEIDGISSDYNNGRNSIRNILDFIKNGKLNKNILGRNKKEVMNSNNSFYNNFKEKNNNNYNNGNDVNENGNNNNDYGGFNLDEKINNDNKVVKSAFIFHKNNSKKSKKVFNDSDNDNNNNNETSSNEEDDENNNNNAFISYNNNRKRNINENKSVKRPIICICNDLYAKQLMPLRKESLIINIRKIDEKKLIDRLYNIVKIEKIPININIIKIICEITKNDIRACLNCLQIINANKNNKEFIDQILKDNYKISMICNKDINENLFNIWNKIIYRKLDEKFLSYQEIKNLYNSCGEYNKIIEGLFNNYIKLQKNSFSDVICRSELTELFSFEDCLNKKGYNYYDINCMSGKYINTYYSTDKFDKNIIEYPSLLYDLKSQSKINDSIIENLKENLISHKIFLNKKNIIKNLIPYIYQLIQPEIREINVDLMKPEEQKQLKNSLNLMLLCGISLKDIY